MVNVRQILLNTEPLLELFVCVTRRVYQYYNCFYQLINRCGWVCLLGFTVFRVIFSHKPTIMLLGFTTSSKYSFDLQLHFAKLSLLKTVYRYNVCKKITYLKTIWIKLYFIYLSFVLQLVSKIPRLRIVKSTVK